MNRSISLALGFTVGNLIWAALVTDDWARAVEISWFQTVAILITAYLYSSEKK